MNKLTTVDIEFTISGKLLIEHYQSWFPSGTDKSLQDEINRLDINDLMGMFDETITLINWSITND